MEVDAPPSGESPPSPDTASPQAPDAKNLGEQIAAVEEQREHLARMLNAGPCQALSNIVLRAEIIDRLLDADPARAAEESRKLRDAAVSALAEVRRFMFDVYPGVLPDLGLVATLRRYVQTMGHSSGQAVEVRVQGDERRLPHEAELALFRVAQAALAGVEHQSTVGNATVSISFDADEAEIRVTTGDTVFTSPADLEASGRRLAGLHGLEAQLAAVGGALQVDNSAGPPATITARVPA